MRQLHRGPFCALFTVSSSNDIRVSNLSESSGQVFFLAIIAGFPVILKYSGETRWITTGPGHNHNYS